MRKSAAKKNPPLRRLTPWVRGTVVVSCFILLLGVNGLHDHDEPPTQTCDATTDADSTCRDDATPLTAGGQDQDNSNDDEDQACRNQHEKCEFWARYAECEKNPRYMIPQCPESCNACQGTLDLNMGVPQSIAYDRQDTKIQVQQRILDARDYVNFVLLDPKHSPVREACRNQHESCAYWATLGECEHNPQYMTLQCAPVCHSCDQLSVQTRCPVDDELHHRSNVWDVGDLNRLFESLLTNGQYEPTVYARPDYLPGDTPETAPYLLGPWVVTLEDVLSQDEAERLIELGATEGYKRSSDVGKMKPDGTFESNINDGRTSTNAWCQNDCYEDPVAQTVIERITNLTSIPETNSEYLQLLKYEPGQYYQAHHDYIAFHRERQQGVRILTVFLYLNDVEEGGGTNFPQYNLTIQPKRGRVLVWPSVYDNDPHVKDPRTEHQALPVVKGVKYGANAWFHQRDFKTPLLNHCT